MNVFDWLASPTGVELQHAIIGLILALTAYLSFLARRQAKSNEQLLNGHLEQHMLNDVLVAQPHAPVPPAEPPASAQP